MKKAFTYILLLFISTATLFESYSQAKKNVIFIGIDDMSIAFDAFGNKDCPAPNLARLLKRGMLFKQTYCQYPICNPSRTSLMSGKRPDATGVIGNQTSMRTLLGSSYKFLPEYFRAYNYRTERFGKVSHTNELSWDNEYDIKFRHFDVSGTPIWWIDTICKTERETVNGRLVDEIVRKISKPLTTPYFYALGLSTHNPYTPTLNAWNKIGDSSKKQLLPVDHYGKITNVRGNGSANILLPNTPQNDTVDIPRIAITTLLNFSPAVWKNFKHAYYSEVAEMDASLGVLLDAMDKLNIWNNTIVVFYSDHGVHLGEHQGLWLKKTLFEESLRVPFVICAPGKKTGVCEKLVELVDIFPTLTDLCELPTPSGMEGLSLLPLLDNPGASWKKAIFSQVTLDSRAVRTMRFHYNSWKGNQEELYDIQNDPYEYTNLAKNGAYASVLNNMRNLLASGWKGALPPTLKTSLETTILAHKFNNNPTDPYLKQNIPNAANGETTISFYTTLGGQIRVSDMKGSIVKIIVVPKGEGQIRINTEELKAGIYNYTLYQKGRFVATRKMVIVK